MKNEKPSSDELLFTNWFNHDQNPEQAWYNGKPQEGMSEDVLIDVDGWRTTFRVGYKNIKEDKWDLYQDDVDIDLEGMKWTTLPLNKAKLNDPN